MLCILIVHSYASSYEFDVHYGFGTSELAYNSVPGVGFTIYPVKNFGFNTGLQYSYRWKTKTSERSGENPIAVDSEGHRFIFRYAVEEYKEELYAYILQVPIMMKYSHDFYYAAGGLKIGSVKKAGADIKYKGLKTEGYYLDYDLPLTEPIFQGFGAHNDSTFKTTKSSKILVMLALEGGVKFKLSSNFSLHTGVFADYSFNEGFNKTLPPLIERVEHSNGANIAGNDTWKAWRPWSVGAVVKVAFDFSPAEAKYALPLQEDLPAIQDTVDRRIVVVADVPPPPVPVQPEPPPIHPAAAQASELAMPPLPNFLLNRKPDFVFNYPETRTSPSDSLHMAMVGEIADTLRTKPDLHLHCVGYSEKLLSQSVAYETALQRSIRIRYTLSRFYGIAENRIFVYSQGSEGLGFRRAECFIL